MTYSFRTLTPDEARALPDGEYDTCPMYGPKVYMSNRRIQKKNGAVRLLEYIDDPMLSFNAAFFFKVNLLVEKQDG